MAVLRKLGATSGWAFFYTNTETQACKSMLNYTLKNAGLF